MIDLDEVGRTALGVAYLRAYESRRPNAVFVDPLALGLYGSAVVDDAGHLRELPPADDEAGRERRAMYHSIVGRTLFLDEVFTTGAADGVRQFVILGAGLDARAFRLDLGPDAVFYELDRPAVTEVKEQLVAEHSLVAHGQRRVVSADLAGDWLTELRSAGFRPGEPTCWLAEGLLAYLDTDVVWQTIAAITSASAAGSRIGLTVRLPGARPPEDPFASVASMWKPDPGIVDRLVASGWECRSADARTVLTAHGREIPTPTGLQATSGATSRALLVSGVHPGGGELAVGPDD